MTKTNKYPFQAVANCHTTAVNNQTELACLQQTISKFASYKRSLCPLLFFLYLFDCLLILSYTFMAIKTQHLFLVAVVASYCLSLSYITLVLDDCWILYKTLPTVLR